MKYSRNEVIKMSKEVHGNKYDYTITEGVNNKIGKIKYICPKHNIIIEQNFHNHLQGKGCQECAKESRRKLKCLTKEELIQKASLYRDDLDNYDFDKTDFTYRDKEGRMEIYCKEHGRFLIRPNHFIHGVIGCKYCNGRKKDEEDMRKELSEMHPSLDFSESNYSEKDKLNRIKVICPEHGVKYINYWNLIHGQGCYECGIKKIGEKSRLTNEEIIRRAEEIYGKDKYTYEHLDTFNRKQNTKIVITCPKHGDFEVTVSNFVSGKSGCPKCKISKLEVRVANFLSRNNIKFVQQKTFEWLKYKSNLYLDFYLPDYNLAIECQGKQHFVPVDTFGGEDGFNEIVIRDNVKKQCCDNNNIKILYYMDNKYKKDKNDFSLLSELLVEIKNNGLN